MDERRGSHLEPDDDEIPESDHAELGSGVSYPSLSILDSDDVHEVQDELESHDAHDEADEITQRIPPINP